MRKTWLGLVLLAGLSLPVSAQARDGTAVGVGTGAVAGAIVGGPIGAVVGAIAGGVIGSSADEARPRYRRRASAKSRRRATVGGAPPRTRLAERIVPARRAPSEIDSRNRPETTGSTGPSPRSAWQDPR